MINDKKPKRFEDIENNLESRFKSYKFKDKYEDWKHLFLTEISNRTLSIGRLKSMTYQGKEHNYALLSSDFKYKNSSGFFYTAQSCNLFVEFGERVGIGGLSHHGVNIIFDKEFSSNQNLVDCVAIHEIVESIAENHKEACFQELNHLFTLNHKDILKYANILFESEPTSSNNYFDRAIPGALKMINKESNKVKRLKMFYQMLSK